MTKPIGMAILGCGYWGVNYVRVLHELNSVGPITVCDQRGERLDAIRSRFPDVHTTPCLDEVLASARTLFGEAAAGEG